MIGSQRVDRNEEDIGLVRVVCDCLFGLHQQEDAEDSRADDEYLSRQLEYRCGSQKRSRHQTPTFELR